jgi:hypothetical protein
VESKLVSQPRFRHDSTAKNMKWSYIRTVVSDREFFGRSQYCIRIGTQRQVAGPRAFGCARRLALELVGETLECRRPYVARNQVRNLAEEADSKMMGKQVPFPCPASFPEREVDYSAGLDRVLLYGRSEEKRH